MTQLAKLLASLRQNPQNVLFADLKKVCDHYFGESRQSGSSHHVYRTPWPGDPRVNIQRGKDGKAKSYQVRQYWRQSRNWRALAMVNHEHYTYRVTWSEEDSEFVGLCAEFPSLSHLAESRAATLDGIVELVRDGCRRYGCE